MLYEELIKKNFNFLVYSELLNEKIDGLKIKVFYTVKRRHLLKTTAL